jgi:hypothetical protein
MSGHEVPERLFLEWARKIIRCQGTMREWGKANGCSVSFVSAVLAGRRPPPDWMLKALGVERRVVYDLPNTPTSNTFRQSAGLLLLECARALSAKAPQ